MSQIVTTQKKLTFNCDEDQKKLINRVADYLGMDEQDYGITDVIYAVFKKVDEKFDPNASKKSDIKEIEKLNKELKTSNERIILLEENHEELSNLITEKDNIIKAKNEEIQDITSENAENIDKYKDKIILDPEEYAQLNSANITLNKQVEEYTEKIANLSSQISGAVKLEENQLIISFSDIQKAYLTELAGNKRFAQFLKKVNQNGKLNDLIDPLIANLNEDIGRVLKGWLFYSAKIGKHPLLPFDKWVKKFKRKK